MGQQQLLLIVLGVIVVGIAIVVGIDLFGESAAAANFDAVMNDMQRIAASAQQWYTKPVALGGGGRSFAGVTLSLINVRSSNNNGTFTVPSTAAGSFNLQGVGVEDGDDDGTAITVSLTVYPDSTSVPTITSR